LNASSPIGGTEKPIGETPYALLLLENHRMKASYASPSKHFAVLQQFNQAAFRRFWAPSGLISARVERQSNSMLFDLVLRAPAQPIDKQRRPK
jgi:hypothetical protein